MVSWSCNLDLWTDIRACYFYMINDLTYHVHVCHEKTLYACEFSQIHWNMSVILGNGMKEKNNLNILTERLKATLLKLYNIMIYEFFVNVMWKW